MEEHQNKHPKVETLLKKFIPEPIQQIRSSTGSKPGDNIIGKMLALQITTESGKKYDLILKSFVSLTEDEPNPMELRFSKVMSAFRVFGNELAYYDRVRPEMKKLVNYSLPTPQTYFSHNDDAGGGLKSCLILEDLRPQGYKMADKIGGLSSLEIFMVLEKIAKFHAASYVYLEKAEILKKSNAADQEDVLTVHVFAKSNGIADGVHTIFMNTIYFDMIDVLKEKKVFATR
ncbi:unnamed protein product [Orchesella dallaii]|uniref:CHK kinase-like domain-containing protein n=1 Tax=Orchesella dallaii TaxID=48710 RepID=A0ABP1RZK8_9HEXA